MSNLKNNKVFKYSLFAIQIGIVAFFAYQLYDFTAAEFLTTNGTYLTRYATDNYIQSVIVFCLVYLFSCIFAVPLPTFLHIFSGILYGTVVGFLINMLCILIGSIASYMVARYFVADYVESLFTKKFTKIKRNLDDNQTWYAFFMRLLPGFSFIWVNFACGAAGVPFRTYVITTMLGMAPKALIYAYGGRILFYYDYASGGYPEEILYLFALLMGFSLVAYGFKRYMDKKHKKLENK